MRTGPSLLRRLLGGVLAAVTITWIAVSIAGYFRSRHELAELFDAHLAQSAALLSAQLSDEGEELELEHAPQLHRYARNVAFQVWERGRRLRLHSKSAPNERLSGQDEGFSDSTADGVRWRVFSTWAAKRHVLVQVGERAEAREAVSRQIAAHLLAPLLFALPLLGAALALAIGRALAPLRALADAVGSRDAQRLEPVVAPDAPREVRPLVERLNALFRRIGESLEKERAFTADAAHELRTPIAGIRAQAQVAREATEDAERRRALDQVLAGCDRAARLAEQLLTLARLDAGQGQLRLVPCDLAQIAREVLAELAPGAHSRGTALALVADPPVPVAGDALLLHVLVRNLVDNAVRYGGPEGTVTVTVERDEEGSRLCVTDRGPGIPSAERQRVLDRFYRSLGTREQGAGLGLSIVSRIAALHGAALELNQGPEGHGLCASVRFPAPAEGRARLVV